MFVDLWGVHMDPEVWPDPYELKPERHLNPVDGTLMRPEQILSFGSGIKYIYKIQILSAAQ